MTLSIAQLQDVIAQLPDPVFIISEDGYYLDCIGGIDAGAYQSGHPLVGNRVVDVLPAERAAWVMEQVQAVLQTGQVRQVEYELDIESIRFIDTEQGPLGRQYYETKIAPLSTRYDGRRAVAWISRNITRSYELQQRLKSLSETDQLTGLYNRRFFFERYPTEVAAFDCSGLIMLDLDHFKQINDLYGHHQGDRVLQCFCACVRHELRSDDLFVRSGGEEFVILLPGVDGESLRRVAERIRLAVSHMVVDPDLPELRVTVSLGTTLVAPWESAGNVLVRADEWLYRAKRAGRNRVAHCMVMARDTSPLPVTPPKQA